jgi:transposase InsO family protein
MKSKRHQRIYDHRLVLLVQQTGDATIATRLGVPRSTVAGWLAREPRAVTTVAVAEGALSELRSKLARLERRNKLLRAVLRVLFALLRTLKPDLSRLRVPAPEKARLLRAIHRTQGVLGLRRVLGLVGLSASRLRAWRNAAQGCVLEDKSSCPKSSPARLTAAEVSAVREMVTSPDLRHVSTGGLAVLAQRVGAVFASASTWCRLVRARGWRRPRARVHPAPPKVGIRASKPNEIWHIDTTLIRLLDHTRVYLHAVIDNFSRRILAWRLVDHFDPATSVAVLVGAGAAVGAGAPRPTLLADAGVENRNKAVDKLIESGILRRILAQTEIHFSNSMIEAWWRTLKHRWLFLHALTTATQVRSLVEFYVAEHNSRLPHAAFDGQTPDEMFFGTGAHVPDALATARAVARQARLATNRAQQCAVCA